MGGARGRGTVVSIMVLLCALLGVAVLLALIVRQGSDQVRVGVVTTLQPHRVWVGEGSGQFCAHVDVPDDVVGLEVGDCVRLQRSGSEILESVTPSQECGTGAVRLRATPAAGGA